jgi:hypothetical protein
MYLHRLIKYSIKHAKITNLLLLFSNLVFNDD